MTNQESDEGCAPFDLICAGAEKLGEVGQGVIGDFVEGLYEGAMAMMKVIGTWWMEAPDPDFDSPGLAALQSDLGYFVWVFALIGFFMALIKMVVSQDARGAMVGIGSQLFRMILATGVYMAAIPLLLTAGDATAQWLLDRATGQEVDFSQLLSPAGAMSSNIGVAFFIYMLMLLGSVVNFLFMIFRNVMFLVLLAFIVVLAAGSGTEAGAQAWKKANGWLLALLLFKPVAAGIYALGFRILNDGLIEIEGMDDFHSSLISGLTGLLILGLAALSLPALIRFIVPAAAVGAGAFSGAAAIGAGVSVAAGAAVIAGGAAGGAAGAVAGGAAGKGAKGAPDLPGGSTGGTGGGSGGSSDSPPSGSTGSTSTDGGAGTASGAASTSGSDAASTAGGATGGNGSSGSAESTSPGSSSSAAPSTAGTSGGSAANSSTAGVADSSGTGTGTPAGAGASPGTSAGSEGSSSQQAPSPSVPSGAQGMTSGAGSHSGGNSVPPGTGGTAAKGSKLRSWSEAARAATQMRGHVASGSAVERPEDETGGQV